jgi:rhodanese-related sulfurtransferase
LHPGDQILLLPDGADFGRSPDRKSAPGVARDDRISVRLFQRAHTNAPAWIEALELQQRLTAGDAVSLVDVRQPEEFTAPPGHLPGAVNIPLADVPGRAGELAARRAPVVLVCKTDRRSATAASQLRAAGLRDVAVLRGGTDGWHRQGLALE